MERANIKFNSDGQPICPICGKAFHRLASHTRQVHKISAAAFKAAYGLDKKKGICSADSSNLSREAVRKNGTANNLKAGAVYRFKKGSKGRTKDMVSQETRIRLRNRLKEPKMIAAMQRSGRAVGKSGLGNKVRWKK
jgi:uncharacterized Zn finger protein (UPF0148 family)